MQALKMLLWVRWRETRLLMGIALLCAISLSAAMLTHFTMFESLVPFYIFSPLFAGTILFSRQDAGGRSLGLPSHMHRLPLAMWKLATADLLYTTLATAMYFAVPVGFYQYLVLSGEDPSYIRGQYPILLVNMALLPLIVLWVLQSVLWLAGPVNLFATMILMLHALGLVMGMYVSRMDRHANVVVTVLMPLAASYAVSVWAVRLDRTGRLAALRGRLERLPLFTGFREKTFASPWQAQVWREGARERGVMLALMIGCLLFAFAIEHANGWPEPLGEYPEAVIRGSVTAAWCAGLLLALRRRRERDTLRAGHMLTLPVPTRLLAEARLRADAGVAALGCMVFLMAYLLSGGWADKALTWVMAAQLAGGMMLVALLYMAALPVLTALVLIAAVYAFCSGLMGILPGDADYVPSLGMTTVIVATVGLIVYSSAKRALSLRLMVEGLVPAVLAGLTVPLIVGPLFGVSWGSPYLLGAAVGALMFWPFLTAPMLMQRMRNR